MIPATASVEMHIIWMVDDEEQRVVLTFDDNDPQQRASKGMFLMMANQALGQNPS